MAAARVSSLLDRVAESRWAGWAAVALTVAAYHAIAAGYVAAFYARLLPHYDSIGSYIMMFDVMNAYDAAGFAKAAALASGFFLSLLQSGFALLAAPLSPPRSPAVVQLYNTLCLAAFMLSLYSAARSLGAPRWNAYLASLLPLLPDVFSDWWGGLSDLQRDPAFVSLLGATFFVWFSFVWRPSRRKALAAGLLAALTLASRDTAPFIVAGAMGPIVLASAVFLWKRGMLRELRWGAWGLLLFGALAAPALYLALIPTLQRRLSAFHYGMGASPAESFAAHWAKPFQIMFGRGADTLTLTLVGLAVLLVLVAALRWRRLVSVDARRLSDARLIAAVAGGVWVAVCIYLIVCVLVGLQALNYSETKFPFYPTLLLFISMLFAAVTSLRTAPGLTRVAAGAAALGVAAAVLGLNAARLDFRLNERLSPEPHYVALGKRLADFFAAQGDSVVIAFIWHDTISFDTLRFYLAEKRVASPPRKFLYTAGGASLDFAIGSTGGLAPEVLLAAIRDQVRRHADFVVVNAGADAYSKPGHHMFIFREGKPVVDSFLHDGKFRVEMEYELWGQQIRVLRNLYRSGGTTG